MPTYEEYERVATPTGMILTRNSWDKMTDTGRQRLFDTVSGKVKLLLTYDELAARLSQVEAARDELKQQLGEQEREKLALVQENQSLHARLGPQPNQAEIDTVLTELQARLGRPAPLVAEAAPAACCKEWHPGEAEKELKDISARLSRAESVLEQTGVIIGRYEVSGLPVYDSDDYVTDAEGCYLTHAEANELLAEQLAAAPTTTGEGKRDEGQSHDSGEQAGQCQVPPVGWRCTRKPGHEGPCAAYPTEGGQDNG